MLKFIGLQVALGSVEHILPVLIWVILLFFGLKKCKKLSSKKQEFIFKSLGIVIATTVISYHIYQVYIGDYNYKTDLPLFLCSLIAVLIPVFTHTQSFRLFEVLVFWIISGTLQGVLTPDIGEGFPSFEYIRYQVVHCGLLSVMAYAVYILNMRPNKKSPIKAFLYLQFYILIMMVVNLQLGANYGYLIQKPIGKSILDFFGPWPYYIIITDLMFIPMYTLIYVGLKRR